MRWDAVIIAVIAAFYIALAVAWVVVLRRAHGEDRTVRLLVIARIGDFVLLAGVLVAVIAWRSWWIVLALVVLSTALGVWRRALRKSADRKGRLSESSRAHAD